MGSNYRLTAEEREQRYDFIIQNLPQYTPSELQTLICDKYKLKRCTARIWIKRARALVREHYHMDREDLITFVLTILETIMVDTVASSTARVAASKQFASITGIIAPIKFEVKEDTQKEDEAMQEAMKDPRIRKAHLDLMTMISKSKQDVP